MPQQDHLQVKEKIISFIRIKGPSLPVHVAKEINTSILFTSAFLSELISEKRLKISKLNVGNSSLYFTQGQEPLLEGFSQHLKGKEKEAFELLKQKKILKDSEQHPAIRVAIREIKDFAIPFKKDEQIYWKYFTASDQELLNKIKEEQKTESLLTNLPEIQIKEEISRINEVKKQFEIAEKKPEIKIEEKPQNFEVFSIQKLKVKANKKEPEKIKEKLSKKGGDKFFNKVKEFLSKKSIEIIDIEGFSKTDLTLKIKVQNKEKLLIAYNKKKIDEKDIINAYKKASKLKQTFIILSLGEPNKKINDFIEAVKNLDEILSIE
ncbi:MAG: hypothetical protein AABY06_03520 [Nanoarchaeota archaeon]